MRFLIVIIFILTFLLHIPTFAGLDTDFQTYSLSSKLIFSGLTPYEDFWADNKPPFYYLLILPGNLIGGKLISFFIIHLLIVSTIGVLLFYIGSKLSKDFDPLIGIFSWLSFQLLTVIQFIEYGNMNGSIVYAVILFELISLIFFKKLINDNEYKSIYCNTVCLGLFAGLAFFTRYSLTIAAIYLLIIFFKMIQSTYPLRFTIKLTFIFSVVTMIPLFIIIHSLSISFSDLLQYTFSYNVSYSGGIDPFRILHDAFNTTRGLMKYLQPIFLVAVPILLFYLYQNKNKIFNEEKFVNKLYFILLLIIPVTSHSFFLHKLSLSGKAILIVINLLFLILILIALLLIINNRNDVSFSSKEKLLNAFKKIPLIQYILLGYLILECIQITIFGTGTKQYPFFFIFAPVCLIIGLLFNNLYRSGNSTIYEYKGKELLTFYYKIVPTLVLILFCAYNYNQKFTSNIERINSISPLEHIYSLINKKYIRSWPEQKLIDHINQNKKSDKDYYNFHRGAYLYLETNTIPPIHIYAYRQHWWNGWGTNYENEKKLTEDLINFKPSIITASKDGLIPDKFKTFFDNHYFRADSFYTNYLGDIYSYESIN